MQLVKFENLPKIEEIQDVPINDNLMDIYKLCQKMEVLCRKENGIGLSAVQVGIPLKLFIVKADEGSKFDPPGKFGYFLNVDYCQKLLSENVDSLEGCLSIRSSNGRLRHFQVKRFSVITLSGYKLNYDSGLNLEKIQNLELTIGGQSIVFQHEADHHRGITIDQIGKEVFLWR